jgi:hypothetical protein
MKAEYIRAFSSHRRQACAIGLIAHDEYLRAELQSLGADDSSHFGAQVVFVIDNAAGLLGELAIMILVRGCDSFF